MNGVTHESRLTRLIALRDQLDQEIATEREVEKRRARRAADQRAAAEARARKERRSAIPAHVVRAWAKTYGHPYPERGRVPDHLIDQYLDANPEAPQMWRRN